MRDNTTVYNISGSVMLPLSGTLTVQERDDSVANEVDLLWAASSSFVLTPFSSSQHEVTRLNAVLSGAVYFTTGSENWNSVVRNTTASEYTNDVMTTPAPVVNEYFTKASLITVNGSDPRFVKYVYTLNADTTASDINTSYFRGPQKTGHSEGYDAQIDGQIVDSNPYDPWFAYIPVGKRGKIRDIKIWVELVNRSRGGDDSAGLGSLQIALVSPNVKFQGGYPLWNMPGADNALYDANPNLTGTDNLVGPKTFQRTVPAVFASGAYILWDGHNASNAIKYGTANLGLQGNWHEFDKDIDMRVVFSDSSVNENPRNRLRIFPSATDASPGTALDAQAALIDELKPLSYYYSPSNFAQRFYSGTFTWSGASASLDGEYVPWYVDPDLTPGLMNETIIGVPPDGWVTGDPNGLFYPWSGNSGSLSNTGTLWAYLTQSYSAGSYAIALDRPNISCSLVVGDTVRIVDVTNTASYHDAVVTAFNQYPSFGRTYSNFPVTATISFQISPALAVAMPSASIVYARSHMSMSLQTAVNQHSWSVGYVYSAGVKYYNPFWLFSEPNAGYTFNDGDVIYRAGRYFVVSSYSDSVSVSTPGGNVPYSQITLKGPVLDKTIQNWSGTEYNSTTPYASGSTIRQATSNYPSTNPETTLSSTFNLGNRWGFSYAFAPPNVVMLIGGYTGSVSAPVSANFVDFIYFSSSGDIQSAYRSGTISNANGNKVIRIHGQSFILNPAPHSGNFYIVVGGGATSTLAITQSSFVASTATVASVTWSAPYTYRYWQQAVYYDGGGGGGGGACPAPWVKIKTVYGDKEAGKIIVGDLLITKPENGALYGAYAVSAVSREKNSLMGLKMDDGRYLEISRHHRFSVGGNWINVENLKKGDKIDGQNPGTVSEITDCSYGEVIRITVDRARTYQLDGLLSHNAKPVGGG